MTGQQQLTNDWREHEGGALTGVVWLAAVRGAISLAPAPPLACTEKCKHQPTG